MNTLEKSLDNHSAAPPLGLYVQCRDLVDPITSGAGIPSAPSNQPVRIELFVENPCDGQRPTRTLRDTIITTALTMDDIAHILMRLRAYVLNRLFQGVGVFPWQCESPRGTAIDSNCQLPRVHLEVDTHCVGSFHFSPAAFVPTQTVVVDASPPRKKRTKRTFSPSVLVSTFASPCAQSAPSIEIVLHSADKRHFTCGAFSLGESIYFSHDEVTSVFLGPHGMQLIPVHYGKTFVVTVAVTEGTAALRQSDLRLRRCAKEVVRRLRTVSDPILCQKESALSFKAAVVVKNAIMNVVERSSNTAFRTRCRRILDGPLMEISSIAQNLDGHSKKARKMAATKRPRKKCV
ncbi:hypothetical protein XU18_1631 [Perkinsela sp. CCAP 1560/4]|nr:hypothetical protein XU18_1631 [Perkinsela sp. CCAP 1560/4]|eukprot:KNH07740.1 hypothetical protein XU18_1631 [Perkinsela sp. CCAP 1560/4]